MNGSVTGTSVVVLVRRWCNYTCIPNNKYPNRSRSTQSSLPYSSCIYSCGHRIRAIAAKAQAQAQDGVDETRLVNGMPKIDKSGRFSSPRAARELALTILYAACLQGLDPVRLFDKRLKAPKIPGYEFNKDALLEYNHMSFAGPPFNAKTPEEQDRLLQIENKQSAIEADILSAPPKLVYSQLVLRFTRKLLVAVSAKWDSHVVDINRIVPSKWQTEPASKILELNILHLAMAEISVIGTQHPIVINEAVDLAKRFCDGAAPPTINGCLRTFVNESRETTGTVLPRFLKGYAKVPVI